MREIKFRAWDRHTRRMLGHDYLLNYKSVFKTYGDTGYLMQFTGLRDKNGNEVYEGDICRGITVYDNDEEEIRVGSVSWNNKRGCWNYPGIIIEMLEVIGNIHENPSLLEAN